MGSDFAKIETIESVNSRILCCRSVFSSSIANISHKVSDNFIAREMTREEFAEIAFSITLVRGESISKKWFVENSCLLLKDALATPLSASKAPIVRLSPVGCSMNFLFSMAKSKTFEGGSKTYRKYVFL